MTMDMALPSTAGEQRLQIVLANGTLYMKFPTALSSQIPNGKQWESSDHTASVRRQTYPASDYALSGISPLTPGSMTPVLSAGS